MVEFALVLPILMMFIFGIVEFGRGYNARIELTAAVREGVRTAALWGGTCAPPATVPVNDRQQCVERAVRDGAPGLVRAEIAVVVGPECSGPANVKVDATYPFKYDIPFVGSRNATLTATGVMRCGG